MCGMKLTKVCLKVRRADVAGVDDEVESLEESFKNEVRLIPTNLHGAGPVH